MHSGLWNKTFEETFLNGFLPRNIRPVRCMREGCSGRGRFHRHGCYFRKSIYLKGIGWITGYCVQRFRCASCGKTFCYIPPNIFKWQRADLFVQQAIATGSTQIFSLLKDFSHRTLLRWKQKWQAWAKVYHPHILNWLLRKSPEMKLDADHCTSGNPLRYLSFLLNQQSAIPWSAIEATAAARFGGWRLKSIPQCLSLLLPISPLVFSKTGKRVPE